MRKPRHFRSTPMAWPPTESDRQVKFQSSMKSRVTILLALVVVFCAGATSGWAYGRRDAAKQRTQRPPWRPDDMQQRVLDGMQRDLDLTLEQRVKMEPILKETWSKIGELQKANGKQIHELVKAQHLQFKPFLSEVQWQKLQEAEARRSRRHGGGTNGPPMDRPMPAGPPPATLPGQ